jgi:hypothetical protein
MVICVLTGPCGIERRMTFLRTFLLALAAASPLVLPVPLMTGPSSRVEWRRRT